MSVLRSALEVCTKIGELLAKRGKRLNVCHRKSVID